MKQQAKPNDEDKIIDDGFSSQEQLKHEEIILEQVKRQNEQPIHKQQVRFKIPPPQEIKDKVYSLRPDIETGWQAKNDQPLPIPIIFENERYDHLIKKMIKNPKSKAKLVYLGPRYENTYYAWYIKSFSFPYAHIKAPNDMKFTNRPFCGQHWEAEEDLLFDSFFQGGNLDCVIKVGERQYDCFMRVDSNTMGHLQWFNFKVKGWKKLLKYKINICNFQKDKCLFSRGMKPYIYSQKKHEKQKIGWQQDGQNVRFDRRPITAAKVYQMQMNSQFRLSFQYYTSYDNDQVQISYCVPYEYTKLTDFLHKLATRPDTKTFLKTSKLCNSLGGLEVPLLLVHQGLSEEMQQIDGITKRCVVISGRAHPGESNGSHMIQGFIEWICSEHKHAVLLRKYIVFKIVPMLNPDGVALGNYRTGLSGRDFNREYKNPDKAVFPQVYNFKKLVADSKAMYGDRLLMFLDFHGHSTKKNTFMYGPQFPIVDKYYYESRIFPKLISNATSMFRYYSCIFKINEVKQSTARAVLLRKLGIPLSYTIETSNGSFFDYELLKDKPYNDLLWKEMGRKVAVALHQYLQLLISAQKSRIQKLKSRNKEKQSKIVTKSKSKQSPIKQQRKTQREKPPSVFTNLQSKAIRHLFQQIKHAQQQKAQHKVSDDEMSEGSSDDQGKQDDLPQEKTNFLFQIIKGGRFKSLSRCKLRTRNKQEMQQQTVQDRQAEDNFQSSHLRRKNSQDETCSEEIFAKKKTIHIRKPNSLSKDRQEEQLKGNTAKIINFSFIQSPKRKKDDRMRMGLPARLNFVELVAGKWSEQRTKKNAVLQDRVVMDLSDPHFRKTFAHQMRKEEAGQPSPPSRRGRFDHYKYRRMLLNNEYLEGS